MNQKIFKRCGLVVVCILFLFILNLLYWTTSNKQSQCVNKLNENKSLSLYEKCSIYQIHLGVCIFGWIVSPEATKQEIYLMWKHGDIEWDNSYVKETMKVYKSKKGYKKNRVYIPYSDIGKLRLSTALNGTEIYTNGKGEKVVGAWFYYPKLQTNTIILGFKFNESLLSYLQDIGWLHAYKFSYKLE